MATTPKPLSIDLVSSNYSSIDLYSIQHPEVINSPYDGENPICQITSNFDYEVASSDSWRLYIDIGLKMIPGLGIEVRSEFDIKPENAAWDDVFVNSLLEPAVEDSFDSCFEGFNVKCKEYHIDNEAPLEVTREMIVAATQLIIDRYFNYRKRDDIANASLIKEIKLEVTPGYFITTVIHGSFIIIDQVLFDNPNFNFTHNRKQFSLHFPFPRYLTLRTHATVDKEYGITLSGLDLVFSLKWIEIAVQLLLGEHADIIIESLENKGFSPEVRQSFFKYATDFTKQINDSLEKSKASILNLHEETDWNRLIKQMKKI